MVVHLLGRHMTSSLKGYLSFTLDKSRLQRLRTRVPFPIALSMPPSLERDPSCLASLPSNSRLLAPLSQHRSSQVTICSPGRRLKSFRISRSSLRDRDRVVTASFMSSSSSSSPRSGWLSSSCSRDGPSPGSSASYTSSSGSLLEEASSSLTKRADFRFQNFFLCTGATDTGTGWFFGSATGPVAGVGVVAVHVAGVGVAAVQVHVTRVRVAAGPVAGV